MGPKTLLGVPSVKQADLPGITHSCSLVSMCSVVALVQVLSASPLEKHFWTNLFSTQPIYTYLTLGCPCAESSPFPGQSGVRGSCLHLPPLTPEPLTLSPRVHIASAPLELQYTVPEA